MSIISRPLAAVAALTNLKLQRAAGGEHHPGTRWRCLHMPMYDLYSFESTLCGCFAAILIWNMYEHIMSFMVPISCPQDASGSITVHLQEMISHLIDPLTGKVRVRLRVKGFHCKSLEAFLIFQVSIGTIFRS